MIIGGSIVLGSVGVLLVAVILFTGLHFVLLPQEEWRLQTRHGNNYLDYKAKVSRWITLTLQRRVRRKLNP
jgi:protein-S-isoprenylcysteine O-methyltransferase Ste14